jgi:hypothetical protein
MRSISSPKNSMRMAPLVEVGGMDLDDVAAHAELAAPKAMSLRS